MFDLDRDALHLIPSGVWWTVWFTERETYVDVCTPAAVGPDEISFVDLDLDVVLEDGALRLEDEDELELHRLRYGYPEHLVIGARAAAAAVAQMIEDGRGPFAPGVAERWWSAVEQG